MDSQTRVFPEEVSRQLNAYKKGKNKNLDYRLHIVGFEISLATWCIKHLEAGVQVAQ